MKRLFGTLLLCGFLFGSLAQAAEPLSKNELQKSAQKRAKQQQKKNAKAQKAAHPKVKKAKKAPKK